MQKERKGHEPKQCYTCSKTEGEAKCHFVRITHMSVCGLIVEETMWQCTDCFGKPKCQFCGNEIVKSEATTSERYDQKHVFCDEDELLMFIRDTEDELASDNDDEGDSETEF